MIDYQRMQRTHRKHKAALTRAGSDPVKVERACRAAVAEWDAIGAWPDDWHRWQCALNDSRPWHSPLSLDAL